MFGAFGRAFRTPDLRKKLLFTIAMMVLYRVGSFIPAPGVDYAKVQSFTSGENALLDMINLFSGGALVQLSILALGIMPYITASIIIQLLRVVIPRFEALHKEGQSGQTKLTQYTRYLTIGLGILQATTIVTLARTGQLFGGGESLLVDDSWVTAGLMILTLTAGTGVIMWMGELITERGVGNGMSLLIFTSIAASFPSVLSSVAGGNNGLRNTLIFIVMVVAVVAIIVFVEQSQRRINVQYAKRMVGRRMYGGTSTYIPVKINIAGVIPVIFASSILQLPTMLAQFGNAEKGWVRWVSANLATTSAPLHLVLFSVMIIFFAFFYTAITFNPDEVADNMKKYGGFIPGIRAGRPTAEFLDYVITRVTTVGALYLALVSLIPTFVFILLGIENIPFGGTSIIIIVGVGLDTVKQVDAQLQQRHYEGFLR